MKYETLVTKNGNYLFATDKERCNNAIEAFDVYMEIAKKFLRADGYKVEMRAYPSGCSIVNPLRLMCASEIVVLFEVEMTRSDDASKRDRILIKGTREPSKEEAKDFLKEDMYNMGYDVVVNVRDVLPEYAMEAFDVSNFHKWPTFR